MTSRCQVTEIRRLLLGAVFVCAGLVGADCEVHASKPNDLPDENLSRQVQFRFERVPWRAVLDWLAEEAGLALHVGDLPTGSFTYSDTRAYTVEEAISRINLFLIPKRYTLVRSDKLLSVISLDDERSVRQLDTMARQVEPHQLAGLGQHDVVKCLLPLGETNAESALQELSGMLLIRDPVVLRATNQLLVTETAGKLRIVKQVIERLRQPGKANGPVKTFPLGQLDPERTLAQVRPHVGLDSLAMTGVEISLSIDAEGNQLLASGSRENLDAIASVIEILQSAEHAAMLTEQHKFKTHEIGDANLQTLTNVLETILSDENVRLAPDPTSNQLAVLGTSMVHDTVSATIDQLNGNNSHQFKTIRLKSIDPRYAALVLREMFDLPDDTDDQIADPDAPRVQADPFTRRLFVRGRPVQISQMERALEQVERSEVTSEDGVWLLPFRGNSRRAKEVLEMAKELWPHENELEVLPMSGAGPGPIEREINKQPSEKKPFASERESAQSSSADEFTKLVNVSGPGATNDNASDARHPKIRVQWTPHGILARSDAGEAIARFERHLQAIAGPLENAAHSLAIFYLKHATVDEANGLLQRLLDASSADLFGAASGSPLNRMLDVSSIGSSAIDELWTTGSATIIPDSRLNRMFVYGTQADLNTIEQHLQKIDRESSIAEIKIFGAPLVVQLKHARATDVAEIIRDAYGGRVAATKKERQAALQQQKAMIAKGSQDEKTQHNAAAKNPAVPTKPQQPQLTLAVDVKGNSLVITAPEQLATQVKKLAIKIDSQAEQSIRVETLRGGNAEDVYLSLVQLFGSGEVRRASPRPQGKSE